jgi:hypothetical protein
MPSVKFFEKTKYMVMSRDQNAGQNGYIQIGNESFETVEQLKYLGNSSSSSTGVLLPTCGF